MSGVGGSRAAGAVSLGLSLLLAVALSALALSEPTEEPLRQAAAPPRSQTPPAPDDVDLSAVVLPPPPRIAPAPAPPAPEVAPPPQPVGKRMAPPPPPEAAPAPPPPEAAEAVPVPETSPESPSDIPQTAALTPQAMREGRTLLRLLERGEGPDIEIAWPAAAADRAALYRLFSRCFGMRTVIIDGDGMVYDVVDGTARAGRFDSDLYSGFVRQPEGGLSAQEAAQVATIRARHGLIGGDVLRLFPRRIDAVFLAALHRIAGRAFDKGVVIHARYRAAAGGVEVADISLDGRRVADLIALPFADRRGCRG